MYGIMKQILLEILINPKEKFLQLPQIHIFGPANQDLKQQQQKSKMPQSWRKNYKTMR